MATISSLHFGIGDLSSGPEAFVWMLVTGNLFWYFVTVIVCTLCIWFLYNGVIFSFGFKSPSWKPGLVIFIFWIVSILAFAAWIAKNVADSLPMFVA